MTKRFEKAYNALYNGFMNGTLAKGCCSACAVGNIVADSLGGTITKEKNGDFSCEVDNSFWNEFFVTIEHEQTLFPDFDNKNHIDYKRLKELTGYSVKELAKIEFAFETNTEIRHYRYPLVSEQQVKEDQFKGLMAVMDVMIELDNIEEGKKYKETFKHKFA